MDYLESIFWSGYCNHERILATSEIEKIVNDFGYISDFQQFSDLSLSVKIELEESKINNLYFALENYMNMSDFEKLNSTSTRERSVFMNITFIKGKGNLRIEIPTVPG